MSEEETPVAAYANATATLKKFIIELEISNVEMKKVITDFSVDAKPLDVSKFADDVLGVLANLSDDETKYPNAKIAIEQINTIKKALAPDSPAAEGAGGSVDSAAPLSSAADDALAKGAAAPASTDASAVVAGAESDSAAAPISSAADDALAKGVAASAAAPADVEGVESDSPPAAKGASPLAAAAPLADDAPLDSAAAPLASAAAPLRTAGAHLASASDAAAAGDAVASAAAPLASAAKTAALKPPVVLSDGTVKYDRGDGTFLYKNDSTSYVGPDEGGKRRQSRTRNRNRNRSKSAHGSKRR
jgi:hypothetical protein